MARAAANVAERLTGVPSNPAAEAGAADWVCGVACGAGGSRAHVGVLAAATIAAATYITFVIVYRLVSHPIPIHSISYSTTTVCKYKHLGTTLLCRSIEFSLLVLGVRMRLALNHAKSSTQTHSRAFP